MPDRLTLAEVHAELDSIYGPAPPPRPPEPPQAPTSAMSVRDAVIAERRRLRFFGLVSHVDTRPTGEAVLRVRRESGEEFHCWAASEHPADVCDAVDAVLVKRIERDRARHAGDVARLRRISRALEDGGDRRAARREARTRAGCVVEDGPWLATAGDRYVRVDGELFQATTEATT
jgi:hypothetical protein